MPYLPRTIDEELTGLLPHVPAIAIDGPKGVGKTGTASRRADTIFYLDEEAQRAALTANFTLDGIPPGTVLLDEWQRAPQVWDSVRRAVDFGAPPGRFLLTGSATPAEGVTTHSGAGRILSLRLRPMGLHERGVHEPSVSLASLLRGETPEIHGLSAFGLVDYVEAITASGLPGIATSPSRVRTAALDGYLHRIVDRDLPERGLRVRRPATLRRWLGAYAAATSTTASYSQLLDATTAGDGTQPAKTTTITYRDQLTQIWILDPVPGWLPQHNELSRLVQAPKHHLADPALAARLLGHTAESLSSPRGVHLLGPLFESLVTLGVRVMAQAAQARVHHVRTRGGDHEIDLIVQGADGRVVAIEVKLSPDITDRDVRHLHWLKAKAPTDVADLMVITTGPTAYRRADGIAVVPLALLGP